MGSREFRILLVDDFEMVRIMLRNALSDLGYNSVDDAEDGRVALVKIKESYAQGKPYHLVFCDWMMPNVNGIEVVEQCRSNPLSKNLPIIMITAEAEQESVIRAIKAGATDYVVKPISPDILEKKVAKFMAKITA